MRILFVVHYFPPESLGGTELYTYHLARELSKAHAVAIFTRRADSSRPEFELDRESRDGLHLFWLNNTFKLLRSFEQIYQDERVDRQFEIVLDEFQPDVVHVQHFTCLSTGIAQVVRRRGLPLLLTLHDFWMMCLRGQRIQTNLTLCSEVVPTTCAACVTPWMEAAFEATVQEKFAAGEEHGGGSNFLGRLRKRIFVCRNHPKPLQEIQKFHAWSRGVLNLCDVVITPSRFMREKFIEFGVDSEKIQFSDNGYPVQLFQHYQKSSHERVRFGFLGSLIPSKGPHLLLDAFLSMHSTDAELHFFGKPAPYEGHANYFDQLQQRAASRADRVFFHGTYPPDQVARVLAEFDVLVVPSLWYENSPLTIHEAFLAKMPVIAANHGGMAEYVKHEVNGLLFEPGNVSDLADKMKRLTASPALRESLRGNTPEVKSIEANAKELEELYRRLVGSRV